jgi:hypothetical protein
MPFQDGLLKGISAHHCRIYSRQGSQTPLVRQMSNPCLFHKISRKTIFWTSVRPVFFFKSSQHHGDFTKKKFQKKPGPFFLFSFKLCQQKPSCFCLNVQIHQNKLITGDFEVCEGANDSTRHPASFDISHDRAIVPNCGFMWISYTGKTMCCWV